MSPENGNYVTRAELQAHIVPMKEDIAEIHTDVKALLLAQAGDTAVEAKARDGGARKLALGGLLVYVLSLGVGIASFVHGF